MSRADWIHKPNFGRYHFYSVIRGELIRQKYRKYIKWSGIIYSFSWNSLPKQSHGSKSVLQDGSPSYETNLKFCDCFGTENYHLISKEIWYHS